MEFLNIISVFLLVGNVAFCLASPVQQDSENRKGQRQKIDNKCRFRLRQALQEPKVCEYGLLSNVYCGRFIINFRKNWETDEPSEFFPDLKKRIEKEGAVIMSVSKELGRMRVCYDLSVEDIALKKKELEKHPAVNSVAYDMKAVPENSK